MNIAIIGGSITEGAGASSYEKSYAYKLEQYLRSKYESLKFLNLGAGGTASDFAIFRLKRDLVDFKPDIIFVEFAVNDRIHLSVDSSVYFEGLIRECSKYTDKIVIIDMPTGLCDACTTIHKKIAYFYNIPIIDVQDLVWRKIGNRETTWTKISVDNFHPNDRGHELYYEIIKKELEKMELEKIKVRVDFKVISKYRFINPRLIGHDDNSIKYYGNWSEESFDLNNKFKFGAVTTSIKDGIIFEFEGKYLGIMFLATKDSGILECTLDEDNIFNLDLYSNSYGEFKYGKIYANLSNTKHIFTIKVSERKNPNSLGNRIIIGGFMVD